MEFMFGQHGPQLSEIFWEALRRFLASRRHIILDAISPEFMQQRAVAYARTVREKYMR